MCGRALCIAKVWCGPNRLYTRPLPPPPHQVYNWVRAKVTPGWVWHPQENMSLFSLKHPRVADHTYWLTHRCVSAFTHPPKTCTRQQWKCINMSICWLAAAPALLQLPFYMRGWAAAQQHKCAGGWIFSGKYILKARKIQLLIMRKTLLWYDICLFRCDSIS